MNFDVLRCWSPYKEPNCSSLSFYELRSWGWRLDLSLKLLELLQCEMDTAVLSHRSQPGPAHSLCRGSHPLCDVSSLPARSPASPRGGLICDVQDPEFPVQQWGQLHGTPLFANATSHLPGCKGNDGPLSSFLPSSFFPSLSLSDGGFADNCKETAPLTLPMSPEVSGFADPFWVAVTFQVWRSVLFFTWAGSKVTLWVFPAVNLNTSFRAQSTQQHEELEGIKCQTDHS